MVMLQRPLVLAAGAAAAAMLAADFVIANLSLTWRPFLLAAVLIVTGAQVMLLRRITGSRFPFVAISVVTFNVVGAAGYLYYRSIESVAEISFALPDGNREFDAAAGIFAIASLSLTGGAMVSALRKRRRTDISGNKSASIDLPSTLARVPVTLALAAATAPLLLAILGTGPAELVDRAYYSYTAGPGWMITVSTILTPLGVAGAAMVLFGRKGRFGRLLAGLLLLAYIAVLLAKDTRTLAIVPMIVLALYVVQRRVGGRKVLSATLVALAFSFVLLQLPLVLRDTVPRAGFGPYIAALTQNPGLVLGSNIGAAAGNVLYSVPLTGFVASDVPSLPSGALLTSLSPLPGNVTGWPALSPLLRANLYTPFSSLGELGLYGPLVLITYFCVVGYLTTRLQALAPMLHGLRSIAMQLALGGLLAAFSLSALQYNLRSTTRYIWYALGLYLIFRLTPVLTRKALQTQPIRDRATISANGRTAIGSGRP